MSNRIVFIVGAGRSGTTMLYKLISLGEEIGFISNYDERFPAWFPSGLLTRILRPYLKTKSESWFAGDGNAYFMKRPWISKIIPTPVEGEFVYGDCSIPITPEQNYQINTTSQNCLHNRIRKISKLTGAKVFAIKRPANNRRIPILNTIFPNALFINLIRDGREVAHSLSKVEWWEGGTLFWAGKKPVELKQEGWHPMAVCANNWLQDVSSVNKGLADIDSERQISIRYEDLISNPVDVLKTLFDFIDLDMSADHIEKVQSLNIQQRTPKWKSEWSSDELQEVIDIQHPLLSELGYL
ncbi:MAG: sulfotransferase [Methylococcales bacterium]